MTESDKADLLELVQLMHDRGQHHMLTGRASSISEGRYAHIEVAEALDRAANRIQTILGLLPPRPEVS